MKTARLLAAWTIVALIALGASYAFGMSFWWAVSMVVVAILLNSIIAETEKRLRLVKRKPASDSDKRF